MSQSASNYPGLPSPGSSSNPSSFVFPAPSQTITTNDDGSLTIEETPAGISSLELATRYGHQIKSYVKPERVDELGVKDILLIHLKTLIDVIPILEGELRNKPTMSNTYALTNLLQNVRDTISDIKAVQTKDDIIKALNEQLADPLLKGVLEDVTKNISIFRGILKPHIKEGREESVDNLLKDLLRALGGDLKQRQQTSYERVAQIVNMVWA